MLKKRYGQHFLSDPGIIRRIVDLSGTLAEDTVLEIGPGAGSLTRELARRAAKVIAVEIDRDLIPALRTSMPPNVEIIEADALDVDLAALAPVPVRFVANLPYNVTTPILKQLIDARQHIRNATVMIQKEVADRIVAVPGAADYGPLSVLLQHYTIPTIGFRVPPGAFRPVPAVWSAVLHLEWRQNVSEGREFTDFVHHAFASRRKKLVNNLAPMFPGSSREEILLRLRNAQIDPGARPENLTVEKFLELFREMH